MFDFFTCFSCKKQTTTKNREKENLMGCVKMKYCDGNGDRICLFYSFKIHLSIGGYKLKLDFHQRSTTSLSLSLSRPTLSFRQTLATRYSAYFYSVPERNDFFVCVWRSSPIRYDISLIKCPKRIFSFFFCNSYQFFMLLLAFLVAEIFACGLLFAYVALCGKSGYLRCDFANASKPASRVCALFPVFHSFAFLQTKPIHSAL